jgi:hypothetical protein
MVTENLLPLGRQVDRHAAPRCCPCRLNHASAVHRQLPRRREPGLWMGLPLPRLVWGERLASVRTLMPEVAPRLPRSKQLASGDG